MKKLNKKTSLYMILFLLMGCNLSYTMELGFTGNQVNNTSNNSGLNSMLFTLYIPKPSENLDKHNNKRESSENLEKPNPKKAKLSLETENTPKLGLATTGNRVNNASETQSYICPTCNKSLSTKRNLNRHEKIHTGEKAYSCQHCSKKFAQKIACLDHENTHTGEKPYKCSYCPGEFASKITHLNHENIHTQKNSYTCSDCTRTFGRLSTLKRHQPICSKIPYIKKPENYTSVLKF